MSVDVKTPTKTQFEHAEFPCGDKKRVPTVTVTGAGAGPPGAGAPPPRPAFQRQTSDYLGNKYSRRRRFSERAGGAEGGNRERYIGAPGFKRNRFFRGNGRGGGYFSGQERIVLPTKFLLGGNINDPLNLNSLSDEAINKALNESTPKSSPLAVPLHRQEVHVIIPPNIEDPLGLNSSEDPALLSPRSLWKKKRKNRPHKKKNQGDKSDINDSLDVSGNSTLNEDFTKPMHVDIDSETTKPQQGDSEVTPPNTDPPLTPSGPTGGQAGSFPGNGGHSKRNDQIVSPVIPQILSPKSRRRKRTSSEGKSDSSGGQMRVSIDSDKSVKSDKTSPHRTKYLKRQYSHSSTQSQPTTPPPGKKQKTYHKDRRPPKQFIYGNYNRYYGYRNPTGSEKDDRLKNFDRAWFEGKEVLDIGCNVGHITLSIAKDLGPKRVVGLDIDPSLISAAKRNVRHYLTTKVANTEKFPSSLVASFGPIAAPPVRDAEEPVVFPNNVMFFTGNYVLESDELVDMTREEYDVILALSVTKWVHLNWGDAGLKRMFRRMYKQLRPGGKLVLEPQLWPSYKKRKKLTEIHLQNYSQIQLRPEQFREYLLRDVGFSTCEALEVPFNKAKGFQRPLQVFTKSSTTQPGSRITTPGRSETCSRGATPRFHVGWSGTTTPTTCDSHSNPATPGYSTTDSPKCPDLTKDPTAKTETLLTLESVLEEEPPNAAGGDAGTAGVTEEVKSLAASSRPLSEMRTNSAPALLETASYGRKTQSSVRAEPTARSPSCSPVPETGDPPEDNMEVEEKQDSQKVTSVKDGQSQASAMTTTTRDSTSPTCYISGAGTAGEQRLSTPEPMQGSKDTEASQQFPSEPPPGGEMPTKNEHENSAPAKP